MAVSACIRLANQKWIETESDKVTQTSPANADQRAIGPLNKNGWNVRASKLPYSLPCGGTGSCSHHAAGVKKWQVKTAGLPSPAFQRGQGVYGAVQQARHPAGKCGFSAADDQSAPLRT